MKFLKKAQGLPMQTIVIAVIALVVLGVIVMIFLGKIGTFGKQISDCKAKGGECKSLATDCEPSKNEAPISGLCTEEKPICCLPV